MKKTKIILLVFILIFGFILRTWKLERIPFGFFCDEADNGYTAYTLLTSGQDEDGRKWPFFLKSLGAYKTPLTTYSMIPFVAWFGLNEKAVRLPIAIFGTLNILFIYLLSKEIYLLIKQKDKDYFKYFPFFSAFFLAISPWQIHFSRTGFEFISLILFTTISFYLFLRALLNKINFIFPGIFFGATLYTYHPAYLQIPLFVVLLIFIFRKEFTEKKINLFLFVFTFLLISLPFFYGIKQGFLLDRFNAIKYQQELSIEKFTFKYLDNFSLTFLFSKGDIGFPGNNLTRHSVRGMGQLYWWQLPLIIIGIYYIFRFKQKPLFSILALLLIYPLGSLLTQDPPFASRTIVGILPFTLISAMGLSFLLTRLDSLLDKNRNKKLYLNILKIKIIFIIVISFFYYLNLYFKEYPLYSSGYWGWQAGPRDIIKYFLSVKDKYQDLVIIGNFNAPDIFLKFYDPENLCRNKCHIGNLDDFNPKKKQLFAIEANKLTEINNNYLILNTEKTVYYPDGSSSFVIGELKSQIKHQ